eukprot:857825-Amorphochlora_amoeboformis.AAC.1
MTLTTSQIIAHNRHDTKNIANHLITVMTLKTLQIIAHGIEDQVPPSRINDADLVEGGQLSLVRLYPGDDKYGKCKHPLTCVQVEYHTFYRC